MDIEIMEFADGPKFRNHTNEVSKANFPSSKGGLGCLRKCVPYKDMANLGRRAYKEKILQKDGQGLGKDV